MNVHLPIDLLHTFSMVHETGSFTRAGEVLHLTQSAVSMKMKRLEEVVGKRLFEKNGRSFKLTPAAETLLEHSARILAAHDEAVAAFSGPDLIGRVSFGCPEDYTARFLPSVLSGFRRSYPRIRVDIISAPSHELYEMMLGGKLDLCLIEGHSEGGRVIHREPVVWATAHRGLVHEQDPLPIAVYHEGCIYRKWALESLQASRKRYWISVTSPSLSSILAAVKSGLAVAPIGASHIDDDLRILGPENGFPMLPVSDVSLHSRSWGNELVERITRHVIQSFKMRASA